MDSRTDGIIVHTETWSNADSGARNGNPALEQSSELLRLAIPLMARHGCGMDPISYFVWYQYLSGKPRGLVQTLDELIRSDHRLDQATTRQLYTDFIDGTDTKLNHRISEQLEQVIDNVSVSAQQSQRSAQGYEAVLDQLSQTLHRQPASDLGAEVAQTLRNTEDIKETMAALVRVLDAGRAEVESLRHQLHHSHELATTDPLTGLLNRAGFSEALVEAMAQSRTQGSTLSLLLLDLDHFKRINDSYGHLLGDKVLRAVSQVLRSSVRNVDRVSRFGGEEFAVVLPSTPLDGALKIADMLRQNIAKCRVREASGKFIDQVTVSIGAGAWTEHEAVDQLIERVDLALYESKRNGRNRVTRAPQALRAL